MVTYDVDTSGLASGLTQLAADLARRTKDASEVSAAAVVREAQGRAARRTGATVGGIGYTESRDETGWIVSVVRPDRPNVPFWLEFGTRYMTARPFLYASAALEQPGHERRIQEAVAVTIQSNGFGE